MGPGRLVGIGRGRRIGQPQQFCFDGVQRQPFFFDHLQLSCTSPIPDRISQAFKHMNTLVAYYLDINSLDEADRSDAQAVRIANVLLCNEITKSWLWPMKLPSVANVTRRAQKAFERGMERGRKKDKEEALVEAAAAAEARAGAAASGAV